MTQRPYCPLREFGKLDLRSSELNIIGSVASVSVPLLYFVDRKCSINS